VISIVVGIITGELRPRVTLLSYPSSHGFEIYYGLTGFIGVSRIVSTWLSTKTIIGIDPATMVLDYLSLPTVAIDEMVDADRELIPDAPKVNPHGHRPTPILPLEPLALEIDSFDDDDDAATAAAPSS
jgi:hypothetical protein